MTSGKKRDLQGQRFGRLLVIRKAPTKNRHTYWLCRCDCGTEKEVRMDALTRGPTVSCGCYHKDAVTKHGMWQSSEYRIWRTMLGRCENPNAHAYELYGGRNITICEQWHTFEGFYADMGPRPAGLSLDRIDNDGNYEPSNCRWATWKQQSRNRRYNHVIEYRGEKKCISEWAEILGMRDSALRGRLASGWSVQEAMETPVRLDNRWRHHKK